VPAEGSPNLVYAQVPLADMTFVERLVGEITAGTPNNGQTL
jgi:hypothetical protein